MVACCGLRGCASPSVVSSCVPGWLSQQVTGMLPPIFSKLQSKFTFSKDDHRHKAKHSNGGRIFNKHQHSARPICVSALSRLSAWRRCLSVCQQEDAESPGPLKIVSMPTICKLISLSFPITLLPFGKNLIWSDCHVTLEKESLRASVMYTCDVIVVKLNALHRRRAISFVTENERWLYNFFWAKLERNLFSDKKQNL